MTETVDHFDRLLQSGDYERVLEEIDKQLDQKVEPNLLLTKVTLLRQMGKVVEALSLLDSLLESTELQNRSFYLDLELEKLYLYWTQYYLNEAHDQVKKIENILDEIDPNPFQLAKYHHLRGNLMGGLGDYYYCIQNHMIALENYRKTNQPKMEALVLNNLGFIYSLIGQTKESELYLLDSLSISIELGIQQDIARTLNNLGMMYHQIGEFDKSEDYLLQSLTIQEQIQNDIEVSYSHFELLRLNIAKNNVEKAHLHYGKLNLLSLNTDYGIIKLRAKLGHAIMLMHDGKYESKVEAVHLFNQIISGKVFHHRYTLSALKYLAHIKLQELEDFQNERILFELELIIEDLLHEGQIQNSVLAITEANLLLSKINLIKGDVDKAKELLKYIQILTEEHNLKYLSIVISNLYDQLLAQMTYWENIGNDVGIKERLDRSEIIFFLKSLERNKIDYITVGKEEPLLFLILTESGSVKYILKFDDNKINEQLIGSFISAINSFFKMALASETRIERVTSGKHTLIIRSEGRYTYCLIVKGQSYYAIKKLDMIVKNLLNNEEYDSILARWSKVPGLDLKLDLSLENMIKSTILMDFSS